MTIGQIIINNQTLSSANNNFSFDVNENLLGEGISVSTLGIYGPPGAEFRFDGSNDIIKLNQTGLLSINNLDKSKAISSITITDNTKNLIMNTGLQIVIDYIGEGISI